MSNSLVKNILKTIEKNGFEAYLVGGVVRDNILGRKTNDIDIATNALPTDLLKIFGTPSKKIEYGSYNIKQKGLNIDITTYRLEKDYIKRHPTHVIYTNDLLGDAKRRDFTMNAIYENKNGEKIDPYNGINDLKKHKIVCIGNPYEKLIEDPLRILRAIRFATTLNMTIDSNLEEAIRKNKEEILTLSKERIKIELEAIFLQNGFGLLKDYGIDKVLGITIDNIIYVPDLIGIWGQIPEREKYIVEKNLKNDIKKIHKIINCGTITMRDIYDNGLYLSLVCADILKISRKEIEKKYKQLPIKKSKELKIDGLIVKKITGCANNEIMFFLKYLENAVINGEIKNKKRELIRALERKYRDVHD